MGSKWGEGSSVAALVLDWGGGGEVEGGGGGGGGELQLHWDGG